MKIKELEQNNKDNAENCKSMEHLISHLKLDHLIDKAKNFNSVDENPVSKLQLEKLKKDMLDNEYRDNTISQGEVRDDKNEGEEEYKEEEIDVEIENNQDEGK